MIIDTVIAYILVIAPVLTAILGIVAGVVKIIKNGKANNKEILASFTELKNQLVDKEQYDALKAELALVHQENRELKKKLNDLLTHFDHIYRGDENGTSENPTV